MERERTTDELYDRAILRERLSGANEINAEQLASIFDFRDLVDELDYQKALGADGTAAAPLSEGFKAKYEEDVQIITGNLAGFDLEIENEIKQDTLITDLITHRNKPGYVHAVRVRRSLLAGALYTLNKPACDVHEISGETPESVSTESDLLKDIPA